MKKKCVIASLIAAMTCCAPAPDEPLGSAAQRLQFCCTGDDLAGNPLPTVCGEGSGPEGDNWDPVLQSSIEAWIAAFKAPDMETVVCGPVSFDPGVTGAEDPPTTDWKCTAAGPFGMRWRSYDVEAQTQAEAVSAYEMWFQENHGTVLFPDPIDSQCVAQLKAVDVMPADVELWRCRAFAKPQLPYYPWDLVYKWVEGDSATTKGGGYFEAVEIFIIQLEAVGLENPSYPGNNVKYWIREPKVQNTVCWQESGGAPTPPDPTPNWWPEDTWP